MIIKIIEIIGKYFSILNYILIFSLNSNIVPARLNIIIIQLNVEMKSIQG